VETGDSDWPEDLRNRPVCRQVDALGSVSEAGSIAGLHKQAVRELGDFYIGTFLKSMFERFASTGELFHRPIGDEVQPIDPTQKRYEVAAYRIIL
jgi:hypothetical protein